MKESPILMSAPMVRAILAGTKTQTRRVVKPHASDDCFVVVNEGKGWWPFRSDDGESSVYTDRNGNWMEEAISCPYGQPGDRLWVRETWQAIDGNERSRRIMTQPNPARGWIEYAATVPEGYEPPPRWRPSIHMPRWASRITLEVTGVHVERLQDISEADAIAEGCTVNHNGYFWGGPHAVSGLKQMATATSAYRDLWEHINGAGSWDANPWVWVVEFRRLP